MNNLSDQAIEQAFRLYDHKVGEGDLTTETVWLYPRHTDAEIKVLEKVEWFPFSIMEAIMKRADTTLTVKLNEKVQAPFSPGDVVAFIEGNGRAILTGWSVSRPLISLLSSVQRRIKDIENILDQARIDVTHNFDLPIGYDKLIRYAVEKGGGISFGTGLDEIIILSQDHISWTGSLHEAIKRTINEVGDRRNLIKVLVELSDPDKVVELIEKKVDFIYCKNLTLNNIERIGDLTKGWVRLIVDESISFDEAKELRSKGVRMYMVNINNQLKTKDLFTIQFEKD